MATLTLDSMEFFAYHGCFDEEQLIGGKFIVDLSFDVRTSEAEKTDLLSKTVNYQKVYETVRREMEIKSHLIEHVARRILDAIYNQFPPVSKITVTVSKINPPVGGKVGKISVTLKK